MRPILLENSMIRILFLLLYAGVSLADGVVSDDIRISSDVLGYDLQYRVFTPDPTHAGGEMPVLFATDGQGYISQGRMPRVLNRLIGKGEIEPIIVVFVDPRDPDRLRNNRRNAQFLCNSDYLRFYSDELIPAIEAAYPVGRQRDDRAIMGLSFGATNAACFGITGAAHFSRLIMQSPANHPVPDLLPAYEQSPLLPLRIFLSTGKPNDNTAANRRFHKVLQDKGYDMQYVEVREGHNWGNWRPLLDDALLYMYATDAAGE